MAPISERILSLDVFRGLVIALMIVVNSQFSSGYPLLEHAQWDGFTLADLVFPSFLFIVGMTSVLSLSRHLHTVNKGTLYKDIIIRSFILFFLGLFLNVFPVGVDFNTIRVYGILQRISICYLICSLIYLHVSTKMQIVILVFLLFGYWLLMTQIPVPGYGAGHLTTESSWVSYLDQILFSSNHLFGKTYDPEGALSTLPSIATTLFGLLIGQLVFSKNYTKPKKCFLMFLLAIICLFSGWIWSFTFPIIKDLWTSSFVLWASGCSLILFIICYLFIDILGYKKWALPFKIFGMNALFAFVFHVLLIKLQILFHVMTSEGSVSLKQFIADSLFSHFNAANYSLLYSLLFLLFNFLVVLSLYKRSIFIRI